MRNFQLMAAGNDTSGIVNAIMRQPELWNQNRLRRDYPGSPHADCDDIWLWFNPVDEANPLAVVNDTEVIAYPAWSALPQVRPIIFGLMRQVEGVRLGRVIISRLAPGKRIGRHADQGAPAQLYERYQVALHCAPGCVFAIEDESRVFNPGEVWWIDNCKEHEVVNNSADDRLAMIVDVLPAP